ncbi:MAG TPA: c-type cytochrome [Solirubrobacterales bacterium]|nr:c-type cytochrome [Solirubrobacterales bacterium]
MKGKDLGFKFWAALAVSAIGMGVVLAFVAGFFLGHFTGHHSTTTVAATSSTSTTEAGGEEGAEAETVAVVGKTGALSPKPPQMSPIGAGLEGVSGLKAALFAAGMPNVESLTPGPEEGSYFASTGAEEGANFVYLVEEGQKPKVVIKNLKPTIGILWYDEQLYVSTMGEVIAYSDWTGSSFASHRPVLQHLPVGELGWNGDIKAGPDGRLYMAIGSPCDHCVPPNRLSATIVSFEPDGSDLQVFASGLRGNAFLEWMPETNLMFAVSNERDDVEIPDEMVLVQQGDNFGYPYCKHHFGSEKSCQGVTRPIATMDSHGAQNGIAFVEGEWGIATEGVSAISTEWTLGKVIQTPITVEGDTYTAAPQQIVGGLKNPSSVIVSSGNPEALLIADYGTGKVYMLEPGEGGEEATKAPEEEAPEEAKKEAPKEAPKEEAATGGGKKASGGEEASGGEAALAVGKGMVESTCSACHTLSEAGATGTVGPNLDELMPSKSLVEHQVTNGGGGMPAFGGTFSKSEIEAVAEYVSKVAGTGNKSLGG